jgi:hypothetical protein
MMMMTMMATTGKGKDAELPGRDSGISEFSRQSAMTANVGSRSTETMALHLFGMDL